MKQFGPESLYTMRIHSVYTLIYRLQFKPCILVIRQLNELAQWGENEFIFYKYVIIADMLHSALWHGNCSNSELKAAILPASALQQGFIWTTCHQILKGKAKIPLPKETNKQTKRLMQCPFTFLPIFFLNKNKSSSPQVEHNLTSKFSGMMGREEWHPACIYN